MPKDWSVAARQLPLLKVTSRAREKGGHLVKVCDGIVERRSKSRIDVHELRHDLKGD